MPYNVHPDYVAILQKEFAKKHGRESSLDFWAISEIVNETYAFAYTNFGGKMSEDAQTVRNVAGMLDREKSYLPLKVRIASSDGAGAVTK